MSEIRTLGYREAQPESQRLKPLVHRRTPLSPIGLAFLSSPSRDLTLPQTIVTAVRPVELAPLRVPHLMWHCSVSRAANSFPISLNALIDDGSHTVLIREDLVLTLGLVRRKLRVPEHVELAMKENKKKSSFVLHDYVKIRLYDPSSFWTAKSVHAIVAPRLCALSS